MAALPVTGFPVLFVISAAHHRAMLDHVRACLPEEGCGLVGGRLYGATARAGLIIPVQNELRSRVRFRMDAASQLKAFYRLEREELDLVAIFHSHPAGPPVPSPTDLAEFAYPGVLSLIWSPRAPSGEWQVRAFGIHPDKSEEAGVRVIDDLESGPGESQPIPQ